MCKFPLKRYLIKRRLLFRCIVQRINGSDSRCETNTVVNSTNKHEINIFFCSLSHSFFILILSILLKMNTIKLCPYAKWVHLVTCNLHTYFNYYTNCKTFWEICQLSIESLSVFFINCPIGSYGLKVSTVFRPTVLLIL